MTDQDPSARRAEFEAGVAAAAEQHREMSEQARAAAARIVELRDRLAARAQSHPGEFAPDGQPTRKSEAARLHTDLRAAETPPVPWDRRVRDAAEQVEVARRKVDAYTAEHVVELVREREPQAREIDSDILEAVGALEALLVHRNQFQQGIASLLAPVQGLDAVGEMASSDFLAPLTRELRDLRRNGLSSPMPKSICPPAGVQAPRVQTPGGWVAAGQAEIVEEHRARRAREQEDRERKARRRVQVSPNQPEPTQEGIAALIRAGVEFR